MAWITLDRSALVEAMEAGYIATDLGYFPHEADCLCDFCLPQNTCQHFHGGDCEHTYNPEAEAAYEAELNKDLDAYWFMAATEAQVMQALADAGLEPTNPDDLPFE